MPNDQYISVILVTVGVCMLAAVAGVIVSKAREKGSSAPAGRPTVIKYKNAAYLYMFMAFAVIMSIAVIASVLVPAEFDLPLVATLFVIDAVLIGVCIARMGRLCKISLYENSFEIYMPNAASKPRYEYLDVLSADQNREGDITIKVKDGKEYIIKTMTDADELLKRIADARSKLQN
ncbi:MAG: hypothetical protein ACI3XO_10705 [Eubacteriales bacterium]